MGQPVEQPHLRWSAGVATAPGIRIAMHAAVITARSQISVRALYPGCHVVIGLSGFQGKTPALSPRFLNRRAAPTLRAGRCGALVGGRPKQGCRRLRRAWSNGSPGRWQVISPLMRRRAWRSSTRDTSSNSGGPLGRVGPLSRPRRGGQGGGGRGSGNRQTFVGFGPVGRRGGGYGIPTHPPPGPPRQAGDVDPPTPPRGLAAAVITMA